MKEIRKGDIICENRFLHTSILFETQDFQNDLKEQFGAANATFPLNE